MQTIQESHAVWTAQVTAAVNAEEQDLLAARNGLEGLAGLMLQHETLTCLRSFLTALRKLLLQRI